MKKISKIIMLSALLGAAAMSTSANAWWGGGPWDGGGWGPWDRGGWGGPSGRDSYDEWDWGPWDGWGGGDATFSISGGGRGNGRGYGRNSNRYYDGYGYGPYGGGGGPYGGGPYGGAPWEGSGPGYYGRPGWSDYYDAPPPPPRGFREPRGYSEAPEGEKK